MKSFWKPKLISTHPVYGSGPHYYKQSLGSAQKKILSEEKKSELNKPWGKMDFVYFQNAICDYFSEV